MRNSGEGRMRIPIIELERTLNLLHIVIRQVNAEGIDVALQMINLASSTNGEDIWSLGFGQIAAMKSGVRYILCASHIEERRS